jgi:hypothetical protein
MIKNSYALKFAPKGWEEIPGNWREFWIQSLKGGFGEFYIHFLKNKYERELTPMDSSTYSIEKCYYHLIFANKIIVALSYFLISLARFLKNTFYYPIHFKKYLLLSYSIISTVFLPLSLVC